MTSSVRNIVKGIFRSRIISTNFGSFSAPSSKVRKTIFWSVGMSLTTGMPPSPVRIGLTAGGAGGGGSSGMPHLRKAAARSPSGEAFGDGDDGDDAVGVSRGAGEPAGVPE